MLPLDKVIAAVEAEGARLRAEFYAPQGPRGRRGSCPADAEIEARLRAVLLRLIDCAFVGEETPADPAGADSAEVWVVDPHDGTFEFMSGKRGSAISVALVRNGVPVLGVVHAPDAPDRGADTLAWAEGCGPLRRNGSPVESDLRSGRLGAEALAWATASSALKPLTWSHAFVPSRYVAMPSIAYRMARVAAGDGVATMSAHPVAEYDIAAGMALVRAVGGVALDAEGREIALTGKPGARISGCYAGVREAAAALARFNWKSLDEEPRREPRITLGFPRREHGQRLLRAQGCLLGQVIGDNLGGAEAFKLLPGQATDDSEMALALARSIVCEGGHNADKVLEAYREWLTSRPVDIDMTTEKGLLGQHADDSQSNGSLMRVSPIGVFAAGDPALAARLARDDSLLTHRNEVCVEACAGFCAAIAVAIDGGDRDAMLAAALSHSKSPAREAIEQGARGKLPDFITHPGWVLVGLQNAFYGLFNARSLDSFLDETVRRGGDMDTNAAIAGALLGSLHGRDAIAPKWILQVLACRPLAEGGALRPRPMDCWPDDILELAEALLLVSPR
jgi:ADP-ribosylglycohydrolase/fructose-1,6-bisphosphatase/inositol monophosphatase family enzyme